MEKVKIVDGDVTIIVFVGPRFLELHIEQGGTDEQAENDFVLQIDKKTKDMTIGGSGKAVLLKGVVLDVVKQFISQLDK